MFVLIKMIIIIQNNNNDNNNNNNYGYDNFFKFYFKVKNVCPSRTCFCLFFLEGGGGIDHRTELCSEFRVRIWKLYLASFFFLIIS